jgi:hypothetical protein
MHIGLHAKRLDSLLEKHFSFGRDNPWLARLLFYDALGLLRRVLL